MKRLFLFGILLISLFQARAQKKSDNLLHYGAGAVSGAFGALIASELSDGNRGWTFAGAVGTSLIAGLVKENIDRNNYNGWDNRELAATVLGGISVGVTIDLFSGKKRRKQRKTSLM